MADARGGYPRALLTLLLALLAVDQLLPDGSMASLVVGAFALLLLPIVVFRGEISV